MNQESFSALASNVLPGLLRYLTRLTNPQDAEDICSDTMATLWQKNLADRLPDVDGEQTLPQLRALAYRVAQGHLLNHRRAARRWRTMLADASRESLAQSDLFADAAAGLIAREAVSAMTATLDPQERLVLALVVDGFSRAEIAAILECSEAAAKMRISRLRKKLREIYDAREEDHERAGFR